MNKIRIAMLLIILLITGIILTVSGVSDLIKLNGSIPDFNFESVADVKKGDFVQGYIANILDCYANETTTNTTMGIETSSRTSREYFIMPLVNDEDAENDLYVTVSAKSYDDRSLLYAVRNDTWAYMDGDTDIEFTELGVCAKVKALDPELKQYLTEWFREVEFYGGGASEIEKHILPFEFAVYDPKTAYINLAIGLVIIAAFAVVGVIAYRKLRPQPAGGLAETGFTAPAGGEGFSESYTPPEPQPIPDIPQPLQPDEFFARPPKAPKPEEVKKEEAPTPAPAPAASADMDAIDTSALFLEESEEKE